MSNFRDVVVPGPVAKGTPAERAAASRTVAWQAVRLEPDRTVEACRDVLEHLGLLEAGA